MVAIEAVHVTVQMNLAFGNMLMLVVGVIITISGLGNGATAGFCAPSDNPGDCAALVAFGSTLQSSVEQHNTTTLC